MHRFTRASLHNRALIALVTLVAAVFGVIGAGQLKQELMPPVDFPVVAVATSYPGATPEVVNTDVTAPIETALRGVPYLKHTRGTSETNRSLVVAEFDYGVDLAATEQKVDRALSRLRDRLPETADWNVFSGSFDDFPVMQIAVSAGRGQSPEATAERLRRVLVPKIEDISGVREAAVLGARGDRVTVTLDREALAARGISREAVRQVLSANGKLTPAGQVTEGDETLAVQAGQKLTSVEQVAALPLASPRGPVTVGDVATVAREHDPVVGLSRVDGRPAVTVAVTKIHTANTVEVSRAVQRVITEQADALDGAKLTVVFDQAPYIERSIETLTTEGLLGLAFAVLVIFVFLFSFRSTLVTAISIPVSVLLTLIALWLSDFSLNMLTLGALTISIGRVVDDSIVVIENIQRHLRPGVDPSRAILRAVAEVATAITASTVTTIAVFLPIAFVEGMVGELFRPFAFTVSFALLASLLVSLTIVPVLASWWLRARRRGRSARRGENDSRPVERAAETGSCGAEAAVDSHGAEAETGSPDSAAAGRDGAEADPHPNRLQRGYLPMIRWTLRRPVVTLLLAVVVFVATGATAPLLKTNFFGDDEQNAVGMVQSLDPGLSLDAQLRQATRVEKRLRAIPEVTTVQTTLGRADRASVFGNGGDGQIRYAITTRENADQARIRERIRQAVSSLDSEFSLGRAGGGIGQRNVVEIAVTAPDADTLASANTRLLKRLKTAKEFAEVESSLSTSRPYVAVTVDRAAAARAGLTEAAVTAIVAGVMSPQEMGTIELDQRTLTVFLAEPSTPQSIAEIRAIEVPTAAGTQRLDELAGVATARGPVSIETGDGVRQATISAVPRGDNLGGAAAAVRSTLAKTTLPAGAEAEIGGVLSEQAEAFTQMGIALLAAILIVYVVMVATFRSLLQPLLLLVSVPFAATGAVLLLLATGVPLGVASLIGALMLVGIVVTNAIVLIDLVNRYRARGVGLRDAVERGAARRVRPIVMTALATIFALTPMALGVTGSGGFISQPLAIVVIGGLVSSTVLTLIVLPTLYYQVERMRERRKRKSER